MCRLCAPDSSWSIERNAWWVLLTDYMIERIHTHSHYLTCGPLYLRGQAPRVLMTCGNLLAAASVSQAGLRLLKPRGRGKCIICLQCVVEEGDELR